MPVCSAQSVVLSDDALCVELSDGRALSVPLAWFPRLLHVTPEERSRYRMIGGGEGLHWEGLDEDISVESLLFGRRSSESPESLAKWARERK